jgi:hypothetical protein
MSETIIGSKSSLYIKDPIPGIDNSIDELTHQSVQNLWDSRGSADVLIHALYATTALPFQIESGSVKRKIKITGHGASVGDFIRMDSGLAESEEVAIIKIIDADFFVIAKEIVASVGDDVFIMKPVTPTYNKDGSLNVSNGPIQFIRDAVAQQVVEDTVTPTNNIALPTRVIDPVTGLPIDFATETSLQELIALQTKEVSETLFFDYTNDGPVDNLNYTELIASTANDIKAMTWFESSGFPMVIALGAIGFEVDLFVIPPGGLNGEIPINIPAGSRVSIKELVSDTISSNTFIVANFYK